MVQWACTVCRTWNNFPATVCKKCGKMFRDNPKYKQDIIWSPSLPGGDAIGASSEAAAAGATAGSITLESSTHPGSFGYGCSGDASTFSETSAHNREPYRTETRVDLLNTEIDNYEATVKMREILEEFNFNGLQFQDMEFPPDERSLYFRSTLAENVNSRKVTWLRPNNIRCQRDCRGLDWTVFRNPTPSDIEQGTLGNCWFLSALAVVAERPQLIEQVMLTKNYQECGAYQIRLCHGGQWKTVTVDDFFPCDPKDVLIYSQARRKQLWVPLIEKAAAKLHGCYEALIAGHCIESLNMLTGAPCETFIINDFDQDDLWGRLLSCHQERYLFGASSGSGSTRSNEAREQEFIQKGLKRKHAYSILDIQDINGNRLIKLKNPWARVEWTGDWSRTSELWMMIPDRKRQEMKKDIGVEGMFWICIADFMRFFSSIDVCRLLSSEWSEVRLPCHLPSLRLFKSAGGNNAGDARRMATSVKVAIVEVYQPTELEIVLQQAPVRHSSNLSLVDLGMMIFRGKDLNSPQPILVAYTRRVIRLVTTLHKVLDPGFYSVVRYSFSPWLLTGELPTDSVITIHSRGLISVVQENLTESYLRNALISMIVKNGQDLKGRQGMTAYYLTRGWSGMMLVAENQMQNMYLHIECDCSDSQNVVSSRGSLRTYDSIPPLSRQLVIILTQLETQERFTVSHRLQHRSSYQQNLGDWGNGKHFPSFEGVLHDVIPM